MDLVNMLRNAVRSLWASCLDCHHRRRGGRIENCKGVFLNMSQSITSPADNIDTRLPRRVRHEIKRRRLQVIGVDKISKHMVRVSFGSKELEGFTSLGFDDHVKLFFPQTDAGAIGPDGQSAPASRDYTPRRYDPK